ARGGAVTREPIVSDGRIAMPLKNKLPPWQPEILLRGLRTLTPRQAETELHNVQRVPSRQAEI
ncbi:hypothetical protein OAD67_02705, partial [bacterium]|nr:hypothetical protein [bacterium]